MEAVRCCKPFLLRSFQVTLSRTKPAHPLCQIPRPVLAYLILYITPSRPSQQNSPAVASLWLVTNKAEASRFRTA